MVEFQPRIDPPALHVTAAFSLNSDTPLTLVYPETGSWGAGDTVLSPVHDPAFNAWSAQVRDELVVPGITIARPFRSRDGRFIVSGWHADSFVPGVPELRADEIVASSFTLHDYTKELDKPRFLSRSIIKLGTEADIFVFADQVSWDNNPAERLSSSLMYQQNCIEHRDRQVDYDEGMALLRTLCPIENPVQCENQVVHGDLFASLLFTDDHPPALRQMVPYYRPVSWAAALIIIDALTWGNYGIDLVERWHDIDDLPYFLVRALIFRIVVFLLHPLAQSQTLTQLKTVHSLLSDYSFLLTW